MLNEIGLFIVMVLSIVVLVTPGLLTLKTNIDLKNHLGIFYQKFVLLNNFESIKVTCKDLNVNDLSIIQMCTALQVLGVIQVIAVSFSFILLLLSHTFKKKNNIRLINNIIIILLATNTLCLVSMIIITTYYKRTMDNSIKENLIKEIKVILDQIKHELNFDYNYYILISSLIISVFIIINFSFLVLKKKKL